VTDTTTKTAEALAAELKKIADRMPNVADCDPLQVRLYELADNLTREALYTVHTAQPQAEPVAADREELLADAIRALIRGEIQCSDDLPEDRRPRHVSARRAFGAVHDLLAARPPVAQQGAAEAVAQGLTDEQIDRAVMAYGRAHDGLQGIEAAREAFRAAFPIGHPVQTPNRIPFGWVRGQDTLTRKAETRRRWEEQGIKHIPVYSDAQPTADLQALCACKDRPADKCPGKWEPGCDLGNNPKHVRVHTPTPDEIKATEAKTRNQCPGPGDALRWALKDCGVTCATDGSAYFNEFALAKLATLLLPHYVNEQGANDETASNG
jgi:hypothetical protein